MYRPGRSDDQVLVNIIHDGTRQSAKWGDGTTANDAYWIPSHPQSSHSITSFYLDNPAGSMSTGYFQSITSSTALPYLCESKSAGEYFYKLILCYHKYIIYQNIKLKLII